MREKIPLVVVLDRIRSLYNVGSVFRTADAFCVERVYLCGITACPPNREIHKTALGAEESVEWKQWGDTVEALEGLRSEGYRLCAVEQAEGSVPMDVWVPEAGEKYALVLGNEVKGVQEAVLSMCDSCIEIPQYGTKRSLNVSVAAALVIRHVCMHVRKCCVSG
ncbi:MAG: RNA methyltransferase [Tannerellaceae bacterium]|jgi:tRNA G18 (ribose-2'-O)-methylase SpoU|nr:RNA methyltransferase [Tannerellaceae bacterium]